MSTQVNPEEIVEQRKLGWPDFHPEDYCHQCGRQNVHSWHSPEWVQLTGSHAGILCPVCFCALDPNAIWVVTRFVEPDADRLVTLTELLNVVSDLGEDANRVASCVLDFLAKRD